MIVLFILLCVLFVAAVAVVAYITARQQRRAAPTFCGQLLLIDTALFLKVRLRQHNVVEFSLRENKSGKSCYVQGFSLKSGDVYHTSGLSASAGHIHVTLRSYRYMAARTILATLNISAWDGQDNHSLGAYEVELNW